LKLLDSQMERNLGLLMVLSFEAQAWDQLQSEMPLDSKLLAFLKEKSSGSLRELRSEENELADQWKGKPTEFDLETWTGRQLLDIPWG